MQFNELSIADGTKDAVAAMGYEHATPIQRDAIPHLLAGRDVIGKAQTGTGKTAAFGIPIIDALRDARSDDVLGLVLVPTRELALQVTEVLSDIAKGSRLAIVPIFGGTGFGAQQKGLGRRGPKMVVACPGRLLDLDQRGWIELGSVQELVLDEADRMLDMGFIHDMRKVLALVPRERRTSLWSATISKEIRRLASDFLRDPVTVEVENPNQTTELTEQFHVRVEKSDKTHMLLSLLHQERPERAVVFTRTKHLAKRLAQRLDGQGWASVALQGNMSQGQRERAMAAFREGEARILVATDVASRGLDVPEVSHVVNFDIPVEKEAYVHRIGRTGRNGRSGRSFTFVQSDEHKDWKAILQVAGCEVPRTDVAAADHEGGPDDPVQPKITPSRPAPGNGGTGRKRRSSNGGSQGQGQAYPRGPGGSGGPGGPGGQRTGSTRRGSGGGQGRGRSRRPGGPGGSGGRSEGHADGRAGGRSGSYGRSGQGSRRSAA